MFISTLLALSRMVGPGDAEIVYSARYYKQGSAKSYYQIYVSGIDGKGKRKLTQDGRDCFAPLWVGKDYVAFADMSPDFRRYDYEPPLKEYVRVHIVNLRTGRVRQIASFEADGSEPSANQSHGLICVSGVNYKIGLDKIERVEYGDLSPHNDPHDIELEDVYDEDVGGIQWQVGSPEIGANFVVKFGWAYGDIAFQKYPVEVSSDDRTLSFDLRGGHVTHAAILDKDSLYLTVENGFRKFYWDQLVYLIDMEAGTATLVHSGFSQLDFDPRRDIYAGGNSETRLTAKLDDGRQMWANWLYAGNWKTGEWWTVADGLVNVDGWSIRPEK